MDSCPLHPPIPIWHNELLLQLPPQALLWCRAIHAHDHLWPLNADVSFSNQAQAALYIWSSALHQVTSLPL